MNSLRTYGLLLANHFDDVDTLFDLIIENKRQSNFLYSLSSSIRIQCSLLLLTYVSSPCLSLQSNKSFLFPYCFPFHSTETLSFFLCVFILGIGNFKVTIFHNYFVFVFKSPSTSLKVEALMSSHHQSCRFEGHHSLWLMKSRYVN
ncbi:hypothetical protein Hdeb2414_s0026g00674221 [Helianthus debilis subsp. tardiflorus]